jgi:hypothetical protein
MAGMGNDTKARAYDKSLANDFVVEKRVAG